MVSTLNCCGVRLASPALAALASSLRASAAASCGGHQVSLVEHRAHRLLQGFQRTGLGNEAAGAELAERCTTAASSCAEIITTGTCGYCPRNSTRPEKP